MQTQPITIKDLQKLDDGNMKIGQQSPEYFAGRCLLDALQFLRNDPKWPARSGHLVNAHAIRLCWGCLKDLGEDYAKRIESYVKETYDWLRVGRNRDVPFYGDDFWDWAYILEAMVSVSDTLTDDRSKKGLADEINEFYRAVNERLDCGLSLKLPADQEWFGPAITTAAHRLLRLAKDYIEDKSGFEACLSNLESKALEPIDHGEYLQRTVRPEYHQWHLGQVVAEFGDHAKAQREALSNIKDIENLNETRDKAYALARVVQGALAVGDKQNSDAALKQLYKYENLSRPLGSGIVGDHPKASLNTLEAIWQSVKPDELKRIARMVDMLIAAHKRTNRIGILVAIERERNACISQFEADGAKHTEQGDVVEINHQGYEVVILKGKAIIEAAVVTANLINDHKVTSVIMVGIAGSLGQSLGRKSKGQRKSKGRRKFRPQPTFKGPVIGDVVIATSTAEYGLRQKVREETTNVPVPFNKSAWTTLPTDLTLFARAHEAALKLKESGVLDQFKVHEGQIVTGNGIKDLPKEKRKILKERPGGLAVAEEGFPAALLSQQYGIPYLELRGISDLAQGDKQEQDPDQEERDQVLAATNAAKVAVALTKSLSKSWQ